MTKAFALTFPTAININARDWTNGADPQELRACLLARPDHSHHCRIRASQIFCGNGAYPSCTNAAKPIGLNDSQELPIVGAKEHHHKTRPLAKRCVGFQTHNAKERSRCREDGEHAIAECEPQTRRIDDRSLR